MNENNKYDLAEHRHRYASWCASRAASVRRKCTFSAKTGKEIIEKSGLQLVSAGWESLPESTDFDKWHKQMREKVLKTAKGNNGVKGKFTHGIAAKLINVYLKTIFVVGAQEKLTDRQSKLLKTIHPPVDRTLLQELARNNVGELRTEWVKYEKKGFSSFDSGEYDSVIQNIRKCTAEGSLWEIEEFFKGYQK
ncbi:MAG: hypothetical protein KBC35_03430 [Candidatus Pacebacteria bacterium]|nr:hypothetical protein [Candidatus Paceibacterota bacterium]